MGSKLALEQSFLSFLKILKFFGKSKKNIEKYVANVIISYCDKIRDCINKNDIEGIEALFTLMRRKIIKAIDSNFKFIKTGNINFQNLSKITKIFQNHRNHHSNLS